MDNTLLETMFHWLSENSQVWGRCWSLWEIC